MLTLRVIHPMKKTLFIIILLALVKLAVHFASNSNYGFHRDELLHLAVSEELRWGYMEFPPFIAVVAKLSHALFDYSVFGARLFPTIAGVCLLVVTCLTALELGGNRKAVTIAGVSVLAFLPFWRNHTLLQPVAFEQLFWVLGLYYFIRFINTRDKKYLLILGVVAGLGLMNKYTFLIWGLALVVAMLFYDKGRLFKDRSLYIAGIIAALIITPNIIWQSMHHFPILIHHQRLQEIQLSELKWWEFGVVQLWFPFTLIISLVGLYFLFFDQHGKQYKSIGVSFVTTFVVMWLMRSKGYYFFAAYPLMFAAGAVAIEKYVVSRAWIYYTTLGILVCSTIPFIPDLAPILPVESFVKWKKLEPDTEGRYALTSDYADMFGWEEQVQLVDSVYRSLSDVERGKCMIWAENYGEAGAIRVIGESYDLPDPVCVHGSFWLLGPGNKTVEVCISIGNEEESVNRVFEDCQLVKMIRHLYAIDEEHNIPLYLCRKPKVDLREKWPELEKYVFD